MSSPPGQPSQFADPNTKELVARLEKKIADLRWWLLFLVFLDSVLYAMLLYLIIVIR